MMDVGPAARDQPSEVVSAPAKSPNLARRILSGGAWTLLGRIGSIGSLFLLHVLLARTLDKADYSAFLTAASVVPLLALASTLGVPWTLMRVLRGEVRDDRGRREALRGAMTLTLMGAVAAAAAYALLANLIPDHPKWLVLRGYPWLVGGWFAMAALCMVAANFLQAEDNFRAAALVGARSGGLIPNAAALVALAAVAWAGALTLGVVLAVQFMAYLVALAMAVWFVHRTLRSPFVDKGEPAAAAEPERRYTAAWYLADSLPNLLNQSIAVLLTEGDLFWIACLANEETVANYGVIRNLRLLVLAPLMVASIALPAFVAELYGRRDLGRLERLLRGSATALALPSLAALAVIFAAPETVIRLVYGERFTEAATALQVMSVGAIVFVLSGSNAMTLTMTGRHRDLLVCSIACLLLYAAISVPLVRHYGVLGAAIALTVQTIVQNLAVTLRVRQTIGIWTIPLASWSAARTEMRQLLRRGKTPR